MLAWICHLVAFVITKITCARSQVACVRIGASGRHFLYICLLFYMCVCKLCARIAVISLLRIVLPLTTELNGDAKTATTCVM